MFLRIIVVPRIWFMHVSAMGIWLMLAILVMQVGSSLFCSLPRYSTNFDGFAGQVTKKRKNAATKLHFVRNKFLCVPASELCLGKISVYTLELS